jgi:HEAT repeat protein
MSDRLFSWPELGSPPSEEFERFRASVDAPIRGREPFDSFDLGTLEALSGDERRVAEDLIIDRLRIDADGRMAAALAAMGSRRVIESLERASERLESGVPRVAVARALARLKGDGGDAGPVIETLRTGSWTQRASAACVLHEFSGPGVEAGLLDALEDENKLVRINALKGLCQRAGISASAATVLSPLGMLRVRIGCGLATVRGAVRRELGDILQALRDGASPAALGLDTSVDMDSEPVRRFRASRDAAAQSDEAPDIDLTGLDELDQATRRWVMHSLITSRAIDARVLRALGEIGDSSMIEPLEEISAGSDANLSAQARAAIDRIRQRESSE